jgi:hypothetical protein
VNQLEPQVPQWLFSANSGEKRLSIVIFSTGTLLKALLCFVSPGTT